MTEHTEPAGYGHAEALAPLARKAIANITPGGWLAALGTTATTVAATLRQLGITGHQADAGRCPVANYLRAHAGLAQPAVSTRAVHDGDRTLGRPPAPVREFIRRFDLDDYPELIAPGGRFTDRH